MSLLKRCFGIPKRKPPPGALSPDDLRKLLEHKKRQNVELMKMIRHLEQDLEFESSCSPSSRTRATRSTKSTTPISTNGRFSGWVKILRSDRPKIWRSAWAKLENGHLKFYQGESARSTRIDDVDLSKHRWQLSFRQGPYSSDAESISEVDLPGIIVMNVLKETPEVYYRLYMNTGSAEAKADWMAALELEICRPDRDRDSDSD